MNDSRVALAVPRRTAESLRRSLREANLLDPGRKIARKGGTVLIPVVSLPPMDLAAYGAEVVVDSSILERPPKRTPFDMISEAAPIEARLKEQLPRAWERLGDVLIIRLPQELEVHAEDVAETYARVLGVKAVLQDVHGVAGDWRLPSARKLWGGETETIHLEDGVRLKLDPAKVMFSSGNFRERVRMSRACRPGEVVVDMFAGIGYFSVPMAVHSRPGKIFSCEVNPEALHYLEENIRINRVQSIRPLFGDCRRVAPEGVADRVIMGYLRAQDHLGKAFRVVGESGLIHYHEACPCELEDERPWGTVREQARMAGRKVELEKFQRLKSYAPGVSHVVLDVRVTS